MNTHAMVTTPRCKDEEPAQARIFGISLRFYVLAYCVFQVGDLVGAWRPGGPEGSGPLIFALWLLPIWVAGMGRAVDDRPQKHLLAAALVLGLLGQLTWLNVLQHGALVLAIVGWRQPLPGQWWWVAASFLWMPASGWALAGLGASLALTLRIAGTVAVSGGVSWRLQRLVKLAVVGVAMLLPSVPAAHAGPIEAPFQSDGIRGLAGSQPPKTSGPEPGTPARAGRIIGAELGTGGTNRLLENSNLRWQQGFNPGAVARPAWPLAARQSLPGSPPRPPLAIAAGRRSGDTRADRGRR